MNFYARLLPPKAKRFPLEPRSALARRLLQSCAGILLVNWCFQGLRGMDRKELAFRLAVEAVATALLAGILLRSGLPALHAVAGAAALAHSLNFLFNGQVWVCARYCAAYRRDPTAIDAHLCRLAQRLRKLAWIDEAVCIGSLAARQGTAGMRSDIDLRLIFQSGTVDWLRVNLLLLWLRSEALVRVIPLDLYAYDDPRSLLRFRQDEPLLVLLDRRQRIARSLPHRRMVQA